MSNLPYYRLLLLHSGSLYVIVVYEYHQYHFSAGTVSDVPLWRQDDVFGQIYYVLWGDRKYNYIQIGAKY